MKSILTVDDSIVCLQMVKTTLSSRYKVIAVTDGASALKYLSQHTCDLILMDYEMPKMNGTDVVKEIKKDPRISGIPVIFLTGSTDAETVKNILFCEPDGYIVKPVVRDELMKIVEKALG